jgi:hypothetical protein
MYFGQMLFLIPQTHDHATSSNYSPMTVSNGEEDTDERREDEEGSKVQPNITCVGKKTEGEEYLTKDKERAAVAGHPEGEE